VKIAGGTGIAPFYQVIDSILHDSSDTQLSLIFANQKETDILLKQQLDDWAQKYPEKFSVFYTLDQPSDHWTQGKGWINPDMIRNLLPPPESNPLILVCGPDPMMQHISGMKPTEQEQGELGGLLKEMGYRKEQVLKL
jgi:cytochrome-b5 reductase